MSSAEVEDTSSTSSHGGISMSEGQKKKMYSKLGCRECKRRKIKCDETKPSCSKCTRLDKVCVYPEIGEKVLRVSKKFLAENPQLSKVSKKEPNHHINHQKRQLAETKSNTPLPSVPSVPSLSYHQHVMSLAHAASIRADTTVSSLSTSLSQASQQQHPSQQHISGPHRPSIHMPPVSPVATQIQASFVPQVPPPLSQMTSLQTLGQHAHLPHGPPPGGPSPGSYQPPYGYALPHLAAYHPAVKYHADLGSPVPPPPQHQHHHQHLPLSPHPPPQHRSADHDMSHPSPASKASVSGSTSGPDHSNAPEPEIPVKSDMLFDNYFNKEDLNLLASDLNNLVGSIMVESNFEIGDDFDMMSSESSSSIMNHISPPSIPIMRSIYSNNSHLEQNTIPRNLPYDYIKVKYPHERYYLEQFYTNFATLILPFNPYQESVGGYYNPSRDVVLFCASKEPFLLAAILAQGAKEAYNSTGLANHEEAYCSYLSKCLKLLGPALNEDPSASDKKSGLQHRRQHTSNIESVLITVLLLTSANASNTKQNWRPHLKGAKDLLLKYSMHSDLKESKLLIFCKTWFISFELLAGLSSAKGGTLQTDAELDSIMKLDDNDDLTILREIGLLSDSGFNYMFGFAHSLLPSIKELIKFMNVARDSAVTTNPTVSSNGAVATPKFPLNTIRMLSEFYQSTKISFVNKKFYLSPDDFFGGSVPNGCLLDVQQVNGKTIVINWMDISHHAYCLGGILSVLTKGFGLSYDDDQVKPVTDQLVGLMKILSDIPMPNFTRWRPLMIQWPMFICGLNCYDEDQMNIVKQFFRISEAGSATFSIRIIDKIWNKHKNNITDESDVDIDLVTY